ncbi:Condensin_II complex subunit H2 [Hexamita inflata]|uniref:Condensin II complex subunit H2 n=1 Tax=Hexamita inflata TaxID=28002 RepID=A0AA86R4D0_9EUKA|nr:Condensin II complex subunit H2 [Hexamita inflata]
MTQQSQSQSQTQLTIAALMKPVKDLAQVWQIDIEPFIDQFVIQITSQLIQDVDFREAALIIQQTTQLFAKKVDFLYDFVNQILVSQPGKQKRRRTTAQQNQDLVLDYEFDDEIDDFGGFFEVFNVENPKIVQQTNLYLLPKHPHTMLSARQVIENSDVRITPVYNSIHQSNALLLEQWNEEDLVQALDNNANIQPINHTTPVHPRYFEQMSTAFSETMRRSGMQFGSPKPVPEQIQLLEAVENPIREQNEAEAEQTYEDVNAFQGEQENLIEIPLENFNEVEQMAKVHTFADFAENFDVDQIEQLNTLIGKQFVKLVNNQAEDDKEELKEMPFQKQKTVKSKEQKQKFKIENYLKVIEDEDEISEDFMGYFFEGELFNGIQTKAVRDFCYKPQEEQQQPSIEPIQPSILQPAPTQTSLQDLSLNDLVSVKITKEKEQPQKPKENIRESTKELYKKEQIKRERATKLYSSDYVKWIQKLETQISKQTVFDIEKVQTFVQKNSKEMVDIRELSHSMTTEKETEKCKLARCFISSLFLASQGKAEFEEDNGNLKVKVIQ